MAGQVAVEQAATELCTVGTTTLVVGTDRKLVDADASRGKLLISADIADVWVSYGSTAAAVRSGHCVRSGAPPFVEESWKGEVHVISTGAAVVGFSETKYGSGDDQGERPTGADSFVPSGPSDTAIPPPTAPPPGTSIP